MSSDAVSRRGLLSLGLAAGATSLAAVQAEEAEQQSAKGQSDRVFRIGVISASIEGQPQKTNGHTWHFCHPLHPNVDQNVIAKYLDKGSVGVYANYFRNPHLNF